jgi:hypothetical protein
MWSERWPEHIVPYQSAVLPGLDGFADTPGLAIHSWQSHSDRRFP